MRLDQDAIERDFAAAVEGLEGLVLDLERIEAFAREIAAGRLNAASNRVSSEMRLAGADEISSLDALGEAERARLREIGQAALDGGRVAVVVLNGGMATRFGGDVKGIVEAVSGLSFLEIKLAQAGERVPFVTMNSFATHRRTLAFLAERGLEDRVLGFLQDVSLRLTPEGEIFREADGRISLYAPGHGDFPGSLRSSGLLARLRSQGVELVMLSNVDNLGATPDPLVIGHHLDSGLALTAEVAATEPGDVGGAPAFVDGVLQIVEGFRYPEGFDASSQPFLATNTFSMSLDLLEAEHALTWFYVEKSVDGRTAVQMEHLVNELSAFVETGFLAVPRHGPQTRFFPIKTREDLDALRADPELVKRFASPSGKRL